MEGVLKKDHLNTRILVLERRKFRGNKLSTKKKNYKKKNYINKSANTVAITAY